MHTHFYVIIPSFRQKLFEGHFTLPSPISRKLYRIRPQKLKLIIRSQTSLSGDTNFDDLGDISRSLDCFASNVS